MSTKVVLMLMQREHQYDVVNPREKPPMPQAPYVSLRVVRSGCYPSLEGSACCRAVRTGKDELGGKWKRDLQRRVRRNGAKNSEDIADRHAFLGGIHRRRNLPLDEQTADKSRINMNSAFDMMTTDTWSCPYHTGWRRRATLPAIFAATKHHSLPSLTYGNCQKGDVRSRDPFRKEPHPRHVFQFHLLLECCHLWPIRSSA
ncbi:hypothetical protein EDD18DRAFT_836131 [Armillaria luteobubalina]|uniref:Uncharacterized protein n=1 Tax=Armillaria luteobubalina TaxID=153913 RepID=A0AA39PA49_9AGAR|nr:hypothetical protein EDD18DRAFT_836131 [Armillaria luteobubalina]